MNSNYRINKDVLLRLEKNLSDRFDFSVYEENGRKQYTCTGEDSYEKTNGVNLDSLVYNFGTYEGRLNKVYSSERLNQISAFESQRIMRGNILLRQGFDFTNVFGVLLVIKELNGNENVLFSNVIQFGDFKISQLSSKELIDGQFWSASYDFLIPDLGNSLTVTSVVILNNNVSLNTNTLGLVNNYPFNPTLYEPLVSEKTISQNIITKLNILEDQYLEIEIATTELNKNVEQTILDYFGIKNIVNITVQHVIRYGVQNNYRTIRISNEDFKYGKLKLAMDFTVFLPQTIIDIFVSTEFNVDNKLMVRSNSVVFDFTNALNPIIANLIVQPSVVYPVRVDIITNIQNTVIQQNTETKIVPIMQSVFVELLTDQDFKFANKNITFKNITKENIGDGVYLVINDSNYITSELTKEGIVYFDLSKTKQIESNGKFKIIRVLDGKLLMSGNVLI
jgi:hypothetical protein